MSEDSFFNMFVAELLTQDYQLPGPEYLQYGTVDGSQDCGIDCVYTFVNGALVTDGFNRTGVAKEPDIDLVVVQAKTTAGFAESPLEKWATYLPRLLVLDRDDQELETFCNPALIRETRKFIDAYVALELRRPRLKIRLYYVTRGVEPSAGVNTKASMACDAVQELFREADIEFEAVGARGLIELSRRPQQVNRVLKLSEAPVTGEAGDGYICLVALHDYFDLIKDPATGRLDTALFEANVRDHEGETDVNSDIQQTLDSPDDSFDFWWLNNGVTIVAEAISHAGKRLTLASPQIVNGLQTTTEIFKYIDSSEEQRTNIRHLLVRVIKASSPRIRDSIVKATNSQNELPLSALRATEPFQRDIEEFLEPRGYFYDRRRNYARTRGYDEKRVVSMNFAGHAVASILHQRPHICRSRGADLLNDDAWYESVFNDKMPLLMFHKAIWLLRRVQAALVQDGTIKGSSVEDWQYHVAFVTAIMLTRVARPKPADIAAIDVENLSDSAILEVKEIVATEFSRAIPASAQWKFLDLSSSDRVVDAIRDRAASLLRSTHWRRWPNEAVPAEYAIRASDVFYKRARGE